MAVTINADDLYRRGGTNDIGVTGTMALDTSYPTGGYVILASAFALAQVRSMFVQPKNGYTFSASLSADKATINLIIYTTAATEVANATNLSAFTNIQFAIEGF